VAEFGDSEWQSTCKKLSYDVKISLYPICSGFTNSAPGQDPLQNSAKSVLR